MKYLLTTIILIMANGLWAQNILHTAMKGKSVEMLNPALVGGQGFGRVNLLSGVSTVSPLSVNFLYANYNTHLSKISGGLSVHYYSKTERFSSNIPQPDVTTDNIGFTYAFQHNIGEKWAFSLGATANYYKNTQLWKDFSQTINNCDGCPSSDVINKAFNVNVGGLIYSKHFFFGASVFNATNRGVAYVDPLSVKLNLGYTFIFNDSISNFTLSALVEHDGLIPNIELQGLFKYKILYLGVKGGLGGYSINSGVQIGFEYDRFRLNYQLGLNDFYWYNTTTRLSHEIGLQIKFPKEVKRQSNSFNHLIY